MLVSIIIVNHQKVKSDNSVFKVTVCVFVAKIPQ